MIKGARKFLVTSCIPQCVLDHLTYYVWRKLVILNFTLESASVLNCKLDLAMEIVKGMARQLVRTMQVHMVIHVLVAIG